MNLIGLTGVAGSGKDTVAGFLRELGWASVAFADLLKMICAEAFPDVPREVWWGSSELRSTPLREGGPTAREALQTLGDWGRALDPDVWVRWGIRRAKSLHGAIHPGVGAGPLRAHRDDEGTYWPSLTACDERGRSA